MVSDLFVKRMGNSAGDAVCGSTQTNPDHSDVMAVVDLRTAVVWDVLVLNVRREQAAESAYSLARTQSEYGPAARFALDGL